MSEIRYPLILFIGSHDQHFDLSNIGRLICILKKKVPHRTWCQLVARNWVTVKRIRSL